MLCFYLPTYLPKDGWVHLVLGILPTGLHINLIHEVARHTKAFTDTEVVNQSGGRGRQGRGKGICFSRAEHFDEYQWSDTNVGVHLDEII